MKDFDKLQYPRDGQIIRLFWSNGSETTHEWRFGKINWDADPHPIGWLPTTDEI